jgi:uncharacterized protein (UPF0262 family)
MPDDRTSSTPASHPAAAAANHNRLVAVELDEGSIARGAASIDHEREVAIYDLIDQNVFGMVGRDDGPYSLKLSIVDDRLMLAITSERAEGEVRHMLSLTSLRRLIKDYFIVCDSYYEAIRTAPPSKIQAIDMGRRALHDEGSRILIERLKDRIVIDHDTARRLFTLICALHWKG